MNARQHEHGITAIAGAHRAKARLIYVRFFRQVVDGRQVIPDGLPAPVFADIGIPFHAMPRHPAAVRRNDDIALRRHQLEVPAEGVKLAHGALGAALAIQQRRVFLFGSKSGG